MVKPRIMVVEDDAIVTAYLERALQQMQYEIVALLATGEAAVEQARVRRPDVVLMDIRLAGKLTGLEAAERIREQTGAPVIYLTAYTDESLLQQAKFTEPYGYLAKPVRDRELRAIIEVALYKSRMDQRLKHINQVLRAIRNVNQLITRERDAQRLLDQACDFVAQTKGYQLVWVGQAGPGHARITPVARAGRGTGYLDGVTITWDESTTGLEPAGTAVRTRQFSLCQDVEINAAGAPWQGLAQAHGFAATAAAPMLLGNRLFGVLAVYVDQPNIFDDAECELLQELANDLAFALRSIETESERRQAEEALKESEERYRSLFENVPAGVYRSTPDGNFLAANPALIQMLGYASSEELMALDISRELYLDPEARHVWSARLMQEGELRNVEITLKRKNGQELVCLENTRIVRDGRGSIMYFEGALTDITERKQHERELEAITAVSAVLRQAQSRAEMLPVITDQAMALLQAGGAALALRDSATGGTVIELARGHWTEWSGIRLPPGEGVSDQVIHSGQLFVTVDITADPCMTHKDLANGLYAAACVPLIAHEKTFGALWVGRERPFGEAEIHLLTAIVDITANAIHRAESSAQTELALHRLTALHEIEAAISASLDLRLTLRVLVNQIIANIGVNAADVLLFDPFLQRLEFAASSGFRTQGIARSKLRLGEDYAGRAVMERQMVTLQNLNEHRTDFLRYPLIEGEGFITYFGIPLIAKGQVKGVLEIFYRSRFEPDAAWMSFLDTLAQQAALAIDNAELVEGMQRTNLEMHLAYDATIEGWSRALDLRDKETEGHTQRVTEMTIKLARELGLAEAELVNIRRGALLHDIGKLGVPDRILFKPGSLSEEEWQIMRQHPTYAFNLLSPIKFLRQALDIPSLHHEKWDGSGYPNGLKGEHIPLAARIFAVVDVWDALTSDRPYRGALSRAQAVEYIQEQAGKHFDPHVARMFLKLFVE